MRRNHHDSNDIVKKLVTMAHIGVPVEVHVLIPVCDMWYYFVISCHPTIYIFDNEQNNNRIQGRSQRLMKCNYDVKNLVNLGRSTNRRISGQIHVFDTCCGLKLGSDYFGQIFGSLTQNTSFTRELANVLLLDLKMGQMQVLRSTGEKLPP